MSKSFISTLTTAKEIDIIEKYQKGFTVKEIVEIYGFNRHVIAKWLKLKGVKMRKNGRGYFNENYFENIDTEEKAYFIGFLLADGCIYASNPPKRPSSSLNIEIHKKDKYILEFLCKELESKNKIRNRKNKNTCSVRFSSNKLCYDLSKMGIIPNKTFTAIFPNSNQIPNNLLSHFLRGLFDGDGCISSTIRKNKNKLDRKCFVFEICGTFNICLGVKNLLNSFLPEENAERKPYFANNMYIFKYTRLNSLQFIYNFLYQNATIFLTRKKEKFQEFLNLS